MFADVLAKADGVINDNCYRSYADFHDKINKKEQIIDNFAHKNPRFAYHDEKMMQKVKTA